ncbi:LOW QUALITY PROTEIN: Xylose isomerase [Frankliniella fusca]|uniref:xylose isomerase n=1 Tax=Frankliniella fusca TaxID=407009 RepID=A0AAE1GVI5_9NEOP|nr:LOW QUALITY PROTEIN: Xylose isomerase [Frankliniella fusca]
MCTSDRSVGDQRQQEYAYGPGIALKDKRAERNGSSFKSRTGTDYEQPRAEGVGWRGALRRARGEGEIPSNPTGHHATVNEPSYDIDSCPARALSPKPAVRETVRLSRTLVNQRQQTKPSTMSKVSSQQQLAAAVAAKRQRVATAAPSSAKADVSEYFSGVPRIEYRPDAGPEEALCYRYYNPSERCHGRTMEEWLRPALSFGHILRNAGSEAYGQPASAQKPWDDGTNSLENYHRRIRAAFELCNKLGVRLWAAWDRDLAPEGDSLEETQRNLDESVDLCLELQQQQPQRAAAGPIRPLWLGADLHSHPRYCQGAGTAPDAGVLAVAGTQVRRALQAAQRLSAECFLFWGGREGYASPLNTDPARELRGYARLLRMTAEHRDRLGYRGQLLLETTPQPPAGSGPGPRQDARASPAPAPVRRYDDCAASAVCLLRQFGLDRHYKISAPPGHQVVVSSAYGMLGSLNATTRDFPPDVREATVVMKSVVEQGGVQPGGLLIGVPLRRETQDARDLVGAYVAVIDCYAKALRAAVKIVADGAFSRNLQQRYLSFHSGFGARLSSGEATLEDCEEHARKLQLQQQQQQQQGTQGEGQHDWGLVGGRPEHWEAVCARYIDAVADPSRE